MRRSILFSLVGVLSLMVACGEPIMTDGEHQGQSVTPAPALVESSRALGTSAIPANGPAAIPSNQTVDGGSLPLTVTQDIPDCGEDCAPLDEEDDPPAIVIGDLKVNGHLLNNQEKRMVVYIGTEVLPDLEQHFGNPDKAMTAAVAVTWWSLKEGVLGTANPLAWSLCDAPRKNLTTDPLALCEEEAWQVGLAGIQAPRPGQTASNARYEETALSCYPEWKVGELLLDFAMEVGFEAQKDKIANSTSHLRASWLLRLPCVGFVEQAPIVTSECIEANKSWCHGTGWPESQRYAADPATAQRSRQDLEAIFKTLR